MKASIRKQLFQFLMCIYQNPELSQSCNRLVCWIYELRSLFLGKGVVFCIEGRQKFVDMPFILFPMPLARNIACLMLQFSGKRMDQIIIFYIFVRSKWQSFCLKLPPCLYEQWFYCWEFNSSHQFLYLF